MKMCTAAKLLDPFHSLRLCSRTGNNNAIYHFMHTREALQTQSPQSRRHLLSLGRLKALEASKALRSRACSTFVGSLLMRYATVFRSRCAHVKHIGLSCTTTRNGKPHFSGLQGVMSSTFAARRRFCAPSNTKHRFQAQIA